MIERELRDRAVAACSQALADYQGGLLDEHELRRALEVSGVVHTTTGTWLLDVDLGRWQQYLPLPRDHRLDAGTVRGWRAGLHELLSTPPLDPQPR